MKIWVDADACPKMVKDIIFKSSYRLKIPVCLVANSYISVAVSDALVTSVQVAHGADVADAYIVEHSSASDLVVTADIPLAALIVEKQAVAIDPRGELYTEQNIRERLSMRNFMHELRSTGVEAGGPPPLNAKDKQKFANALDRILTKMLKERA